MAFSLFWDTVSITSVLLKGGLIRGTPGPKTNYMVNLNNFSITSPILDFKATLDRARQDLKLCIKGQFPRGNFYSTLEPIFNFKINDFLIVLSLFWDTISIAKFLPSEGLIEGTPGPKNQLHVKFQ